MAQNQGGLRYDPEQLLEDQLSSLETWSPMAAGLKPFIFRALELRISVQASWHTHCSIQDDDGVTTSYPYWDGNFVSITERGPFPLGQATSFELAIQRPQAIFDFLNPLVVLKGHITQDVMDALGPCWEGDEIGSEVPKTSVVNMLTQLAQAETKKCNEGKKRTRDREAVYVEELMQHVWHPDNASAFEALNA